MIPILWVKGCDVEQIWETIEPLIAKAMMRTGVIKSFDPEFVKLQVLSERWQCWVGTENDAIKVVYITFIENFPKRKVLEIPLVGAIDNLIDMWIDHIEVFKNFAKAHGCSAVRGGGRKGWEKKLNPDAVRIEFEIEV